MGKTKQQQRPKRKKLKQGAHDKSKMREVMQRLAQQKANNKGKTQNLTSITQINQAKHKQIIKKSKQTNKKLQADQHQENQNIKKVEQSKPKINIFAVDAFQSEKPVMITNSIVEKQLQMEHQQDLQSKARKVMGENFNLDKFGDKPLRIISQNNEPLVMSDDQDQPNSLKTITHQNLKVPSGNKTIKRKKQIQEIRQKLPIFMKEQQIVETVNTHLVTIVCGETGSGKSTQLPQFLAQKNYQTLGKIAITQPRRLATISLARRVSQQMNYKIGQQVAYQVRHQRKQSQSSFIKFMTDGILLKQMCSDPLLLDYSVIIIDQAHERKLNTDILIGLLSKLILIRYKMSQQNKCNPLRLVVMSATLRVTDFQNQKLFNFQVPILKVQAKMYPVTIFHQKNTPQNYIDSAVKKCIKIQKQLPQGDVLIFLTGKQQIHEMSIKLQMALSRLKIQDRQAMQDESMQNNDEIKVQGQYMAEQKPIRKNSSSGNHGHGHHITNYIIYKLYSSLPTEEQDKIFKETPQGSRKFIISTNIAQTSITVPNIRYVIDSGQQKHRYFDGVWRWSKGWGSRAMATQRSGRAGRTTHGYCYRLYSSALYANIMEEHPQPQICKLPLESVVLQIKAIGYNNVFAFPFPTPPSNLSLKQSIQNLIQAGALQGEVILKKIKKPIKKQQSKLKQSQNKQMQQQQQSQQQITQVSQNCKITQLGKVISFIPLAPKLAKMLLLGRQLKLQKYIIIIAVLLTVQSIFKIKYNKTYDNDQYETNKAKKNKIIELRKSQLNQFKQKYKKYIDKQSGSDIFISMNIAGQFLQHIYKHHTQNKNIKQKQNDYFHQTQSIQQIIQNIANKLDINTNIMRQFYYNCDQICQIYETLTQNKINLSTYQKPTNKQYQLLLQILLSTYCKNICRLQQNNIYVNKQQQKVYIHRMSLLYKQKYMFTGCIQFMVNQTNGRKYMKYPFKITNYQLLSTFGKVKQPSQYSWKDNCVVGLATGEIYGWEIPNLIVKEMKGQAKYYAFARMLLSGTIISGFKILTEKNWLNYPISNIRPDNLQEKVQRLVHTIKIYDITSKQKLIQCTKNDARFLQKQIKLWLNVKNYQNFYQTLRKMITQTDNQ